uniref:Uncharacterized protein n=1 Tax=Panagrellus redivivus TaxID=6233 RepID=A0A7E4V0U4_PANRE
MIIDKSPLESFKTEPKQGDHNLFDNLDRTTIPSNTPSERTTIPETVNFNRRKTGPQEMKLTRSEEAEMMLVKKDLVKNLEMFVEKHTYDAAIEKENERLRILRRSRQDPAASDLSYCKLYSICNEQLKFVQKECEDSGGRLVPGLPKRRFGDCNKRLVAQYKRVDKMRKRLEKGYDTCLADRITSKNASSISTCPSDWPVLPLFEEQYICDQRKRVIQNHCTKLARCCSAAQDCRATLDSSTLSKNLVNKQERLAEASAKCQIRAYNDYKKYQSSSPASKPTVQRHRLHAVKTVTMVKPITTTVKPLPTLVTPARRRSQHHNQSPLQPAPFLQPLIFGDVNRQRISIPMNGDDLNLYTRKQRRRNLL